MIQSRTLVARRMSAVTCLVTLTYSVRADPIELRCGSASLLVSQDSGRITLLTDQSGRRLSRGEGGLYIFDGESGRECFPIRAHDLRVDAQSLAFSVDANDATLSINCQVRPHGAASLWDVSVANLGNKLRLIELRLGLPLQLSGDWQYWDGYDGDVIGAGPTRACDHESNLYACNAAPTVRRGDDPSAAPRSWIKWHRLGNLGVFPLNAVYSSDTGFALGVSPERPLSYYSGGVQPTASPREAFYYAVKLVVDPGKTAHCTFVLFGFQPTYGYRKAIEIYYKQFASAFSLRDGLDPRVLLPATGTYLGVHENIARHGLVALWREHCRRYYIGWTWLYAPFQRAGDFWVDSDTFDFKHWRRSRDDTAKSAEEYQRRMVEANRAARVGCAIGYYAIPQRCNMALADAAYPQSHIVRIDGRFHKGGTGVLGWPLSSMFAMNNPFGRNCEQELQQILRNAHVDGIAFDNAFAHEMHTSLGMAESQGRAFYHGKPYVLNHLAYFHLMKQVRETAALTPGGFRPTVFSNGAYNIFSAQATDVGLIEYHPYPPAKVPGRFAALRYLLGPHKPISFKVHGRTKPGHILDTKPVAEDDIEIQMNLRLYSLLALLRWGGYPRVREALGSADLIDALPVLVALREAGWQPVPAVKGGNGLWIERFGRGMDTHLVIINPRERAFSGTLAIDLKEIGIPATPFGRIYGDGELECRIDRGQALLDLTLPPVWFQVLRVKRQSPTPVRFLPDEDAVLALPYVQDDRPNVAVVATPHSPPAIGECVDHIRTYFLYLQLAETFERWFQTNGRTPAPDLSSATPIESIVDSEMPTPRVVIEFRSAKTTSPAVEVVGDRRVRLIAASAGGHAAPTAAFLRLLDRRFRRFGYDGWLDTYPSRAGQLAPGGHPFRRHGWTQFLKLMQKRYRPNKRGR